MIKLRPPQWLRGPVQGMSWRRTVEKVVDAFGRDNAGTLAAGVAYYGVMSFFPLIAAVVAISSLVIQPAHVSTVFSAIAAYFPPDIAKLVTSQLTAVSGKTASNTFVAIAGLLLALFGLGAAVENLMRGLNVTHKLTETRHAFVLKLTSTGLTLLYTCGALLVGAALVSGGDLVRSLGLSDAEVAFIRTVRWGFVAAMALVAIATLYRFGPNRDKRTTSARRLVTPGAIVATVLWLVGTWLFFTYIEKFSNFSNSYSLFAGIIGLMVWLQLSATIVLLGAEYDHVLDNARKNVT